MKRGSGSKQKGGEFERKVCKSLSLWVSHGKSQDLFWRSAMSGGRATVARKSGVSLSRHAGDISATAPEGHALTDVYYIECKAYKKLNIDRLLTRSGTLYNFWITTCREAKINSRYPLMVVRENNFPTLLLVEEGRFTAKQGTPVAVIPALKLALYLFEDVVKIPFKPPRKGK